VKIVDRDTNASLLAGPVPRGERDYDSEHPVSDGEFRALARLYDYDRAPLNARVEQVDSSHADWIRETITFDATYGERMKAHLLLPRRGRPPFQTVVFIPGGNGFNPGPSDAQISSQPFLSGSGRAVMYPVLKNTFERITDRANFAAGAVHNMSGEMLGPNTYRDEIIMMVKDVRRAVDYLTTRPEVDTTKLAYLGHSWGARVGPIAIAVEPRFRVALLHLGGLMTAPRRPEADEFNFLPRVKVPTLLLSGKYDDVFPLEHMVLPYYRLLGSAPDQKRHVVYPTQHFLPRDQQIAETLNWLDRFFGKP
jgi:cephalosporin-C deacetylase-like acetyl esterase